MMRRAALLASVLLVATSCAYPEFRFAPESGTERADTEPVVADVSAEVEIDSDAAEDASADDTVMVVDSVGDAEAEAPADTADTAVVDTAGTYVTLLARGATWRYLDDGTTPTSSNWRGGGGYDDSKWKSGAAQLGYGDGDEKTLIADGVPDSGVRYTTYYFRRFITVTDAASFDTITVRLLRDDGALVYFNGREVARTNMPSGTVSSTTFASTAISGADEDTFYTYTVSAAMLAEGSNVIAVEVHQANSTSTDLSFDLELVGHKP